MTPGNAASAVAQPVELTPENAELLAGYADHLEHSPLTGHSPRTYLGAIRAYLTLFQNQADRWKTGRDLTNVQRVDLAVYETPIAQLRQVNSDVLAEAAELSHGTIETVLAKFDLWLGMEALLRSPPA